MAARSLEGCEGNRYESLGKALRASFTCSRCRDYAGNPPEFAGYGTTDDGVVAFTTPERRAERLSAMADERAP